MFLPFLGGGQPLSIEVELKQSAGKEIYLANYYLGNIYAKDTLLLDEAGKGTFTADTLLPQGLYKIFADENNHFDFLLGTDQSFILKNDTYLAETLHAEGASETEAFVRYTRFLKDLQQQNAVLRKQMETASTQEKQHLVRKMEDLTAGLHNYWDKTAAEFPDAFITKFIKANHVPSLDVSALPKEEQQNDSLLLVRRFYYQQEHFWDNFDYTDERFLYTPFYKQKLETWFTKVLFQSYDSIREPVFEFIEKVRPHKRIYQFAVSWFLNSSINSKIMGMDALFVDLARKYYLSGEAFWASEEAMEKIRENVLFLENNLVGMTAPDLTLEGVDGQYHNLHSIGAGHTIVVIYEPGCSHCKVLVPELYNEIYLPFRDKGLEVFAIYSMNDRTEWEKFISEHNLHDWINVWDEHHVSRFKVLYDARTTPGLYLLDKDKKIIAKKISVEFLKTILNHELD